MVVDMKKNFYSILRIVFMLSLVRANISAQSENMNFKIFENGKIKLSVANNGDMAMGSWYGLGSYQNEKFLYSGGFLMCGLANDSLWVTAQNSRFRYYDWIPGKVGESHVGSNSGVYTLNADDPPFGDSWKNWERAVELGADYFDGNKNGRYDPVDYNRNSKWDYNEDRPDYIGDNLIWCIYNDGLPSEDRRIYPRVSPLGIEIKQTVYGIEQHTGVDNIIFIRYRITNTGSIAERLDSVYMGILTDPDIGYERNDLMGCDLEGNAGYVYNSFSDTTINRNVLSFWVKLINGPVDYVDGDSYIDENGNDNYDDGETELKQCIIHKGPYLGKKNTWSNPG